MPVYELEILEHEGGVTRGEHVPSAGASYDVNDSFEHEGANVTGEADRGDRTHRHRPTPHLRC